jgi:hypothetical protein
LTAILDIRAGDANLKVLHTTNAQREIGLGVSEGVASRVWSRSYTPLF